MTYYIDTCIRNRIEIGLTTKKPVSISWLTVKSKDVDDISGKKKSFFWHKKVATFMLHNFLVCVSLRKTTNKIVSCQPYWNAYNKKKLGYLENPLTEY